MSQIKITLVYGCFLLSLFFTNSLKAQTVYIPDSNLANYMRNIAPFCMPGSTGNYLDTSLAKQANIGQFNISYQNVKNLYGVQFFEKSYLFRCSNNTIDSINYIPRNVFYLDISGCNAKYMRYMPDSVTQFTCYGDSLKSLPRLSKKLIVMDVEYNALDSLPSLPATLEVLHCDFNNLNILPALPNSIVNLTCSNNHLFSLPSLPSKLAIVDAQNNSLTSLPQLTANLRELYCQNNHLTSLPAFPDSLTKLVCNYNSLSSLPQVPKSLKQLWCSHNQISKLPPIPLYIQSLNISSNPISCLPNKFIALQNFHFDFTNIQCMPNRFNCVNCTPNANLMPVCDSTSGCPLFWNISGNTHLDSSTICTIDSLYPGKKLEGIKLRISENGISSETAYTGASGEYLFDTKTFGTYKIDIDTTDFPLYVSCPDSGFRVETLSIQDSLKYHADLGLKCKGTDVSVGSISGRFNPNILTYVNIQAGDINKYGCSNGTPGLVIIKINGPANYISPAPGALFPNYFSSDSLVYIVANFDSINAKKDFNISVQTNSTAQQGDNVCITVQIINSISEINLGNNAKRICFEVSNSFDPNLKTVYPTTIDSASSDWLYYTIYFQNTGNDTAYNISIIDTISWRLNMNSFQILGSSHDVRASQNSTILNFQFPNIKLVDSLHNEPFSHGWLQFRLRTNPLECNPGDIIPNRAAIIFDTNIPVLTNRLLTPVITPLHTKTEQSLIKDTPIIFPNPTENLINFVFKNHNQKIIILNDLFGRELLYKKINGQNSVSIDISTLIPAVYIAIVKDGTYKSYYKFVKK